MLVDTHTHLYAEEFDADAEDVISRAKAAGVEKILLPNIDKDSIERLHRFAAKFSHTVFPMMGLHPTSVGKDWQSQLSCMKPLFSERKYIAVGEIGLDLYWSKEFAVEQKKAFVEQLHWSLEYDLPVSIHSRDAVPEVVECIHLVGADKLRGVFHSFGGNAEELQSVLPLKNFMIGVNGVVTFKNSTLPALLKNVDLSRIVVETDAPYLSPVPYRGKRNESSYIPHIIIKLSEIYTLPAEAVARITTENAHRMFNF